MGQVKIIFFDIDGTLIDMQKKQITGRTLETLRRLKEKGIRICLATGRSPVSLPRFENLEFDAYLTFNGSLCYTKEETIFSNPIPASDVQRLIQNATNMGRPVAVATKQRIAANGIDEDLAEYYSFAHSNLTVAPDFAEVAQQKIYQVMLGCREQDYPTILEGVDHAKIAAWWDRAVDIIPVSGGKGAGIQNILNYYHLKRCEALAFGDGNNDIEMLRSVGTGVAMKNASPQLIAIADEVCGHVAEDGIYHYCIDHQLI
ncbi:MAG: Cof-type HAD-IIB family hydrolase [Suilimivivens sp.]